MIRIINGETRIGLTEGLVEIAVSKAFGQELLDVRDAMLVSGDISQVALLAKESLLHTALIKPLAPIELYVSRCNVYCRGDNQILSETIDL